MNDAVQNVIDSLQSFEKDREQILMNLVKDHNNEVLQMNVDQLFSGIDADGKAISPAYAASTIKAKKRKGDPYNRVTTRDEGNHHESIFSTYRSDEFELDAADPVKKYLVRKYGEKLYGLTEENIERLTNLIKDEFFEIARKRILQ